MAFSALFFRQAAVFSSALIYWTGVIIHARRLRKQTGRSPNTKPRSLKEKLLLAGWSFVIAGWAGQPFVAADYSSTLLFVSDIVFYPFFIFTGLLLIVCGQLGTLWCYKTLGDSWRIWINRDEQTILVKHGPYNFVRHPIYSFQVVILIGTVLLLPTLFSLVILTVHLICVRIKAMDEEAYLADIHGSEYSAYILQTGRLFPEWKNLRRILSSKQNP